MICPRCGKEVSITTIRNKRMCYGCWKAMKSAATACALQEKP